MATQCYRSSLTSKAGCSEPHTMSTSNITF